MTRFRHGAATATGSVRKLNEDSYLARSPMYAIADGMGGHGSGELASALAIGALSECTGGIALSVDEVLATLTKANRAIVAATAERGNAGGMGTTVTGLAQIETAGGSHMMVFNVGDSRVYRFAHGRLDQVTVDHSEVQELVLAGDITPDQARTHPRRNIITRALGSDPAPSPDHWLLPAMAGDRYLLCSDGLFSELTDSQIHQFLADEDPQQAAAALVAAAEEAGGHDNITVVVVDVYSDEDGAAGADTTPRELLPGQP
jgi:protein phosphatase